jgi:hypothetical protein
VPDLRRYAVYGLTIESAFPLGTLAAPSGGEPADLRILRAPPDAFAGFDATPRAGAWYRHEALAEGGVYFGVPDVLQAMISADGRTARCAPACGGDLRSFEANVLNFVLAVALTLQGEEPLHATALRIGQRIVGLLGDSGAGKSTLAATLLARGAELLTDDMLRIGYRAGEAMAYRGPPRLKLFDEDARRLLPDAARDAAFNPMSGKLLVEVASAHDDCFPLSALCWLDEAMPAEGEPVAVRRVQGAEAIRILLASTLHRDHRPPQRTGRQLNALEQLARAVPLFALGYARRHDLLPMVADAACRCVADRA